MPRPTSEDKKLEWKALIEQQNQSGLSVKKWCLQNKIPHSTLQYWKEKLFPKPLQKESFTELNIKRSDAISLQACGISVRLSGDCDPILRRQILTLFAGDLC